jgi:TolA-binding protein
MTPSRLLLLHAIGAAGFVLLVLGIAARGDPPADKDKKELTGKNADAPLVERLMAARKEYQLTLESLRAYYIKIGDTPRARMAEEELLQFHRINKQVYKLEMDPPPPTLKGGFNIPEANKLYIQAMRYKDKGWGNDYIDNQRRAELLLQKLLTEYPQSTKISDAAYQLGDLYESRAFRQLPRAAAYYERCFQWNKQTQHDARIRAARLYELQVNERARASEIYKEIITHETNEKHREEARRRLQELSGKR